MVSFSRLSITLAWLALFAPTVVAAPARALSTRPVDRAALADTPPAPRWAIYWDKYVAGENGLPSPEKLKGFNVLYLSFLLTSGAADQAQQWASLSADTRKSMKTQYADAGIKVMVSALGETEQPVTAKVDPVETARKFASFVKEYELDGIDVDFEDFPAIDAADGGAEAWLATLTKTLRSELPAGEYIITHAPVAPWFSTAKYPAGAYTKVHNDAGDLIDWYNIQFYNQGVDEYTTCDTLNDHSNDATWPQTSVMQIAQTVGLHKAVLGKTARPSDGNNGYMDPKALATCLSKLKNEGWDAGLMVWEYPDAKGAWLQAARAESWPV
ncbi:glycoside hydrolase family 18 protein [Botryobasidium botryosum FD-172 SS1]|uniref:Glycoside hydrolase family 18 protein n=1 Tax=Botryobasidium botryosum (strain FD-172 SS1) TaxID=930990 RepID=A0A067N8E0_BOTB1|nr:glycoside hydrolase family 18 protein [Botryobasidium botryosum FD-172 SS1]